jgi:hypothetical protein
MSEKNSDDTSIAFTATESDNLSGLARSFAKVGLFIELAAATSRGIQHGFFEDSSTTQFIAGALAESSTQLHQMTPEIRARLQALFDAARYEIIEDGMPNVVSDRLPQLINKDVNIVIPALVSAIEAGRTTPIVAAEVLKTLGRLRNPATHASRRWVLERALGLSSPFIRDGAGLGLARLADPGAIPYLRRAIEAEPNPQIRADLQAVVDELAELINENGAPAASSDQA